MDIRDESMTAVTQSPPPAPRSIGPNRRLLRHKKTNLFYKNSGEWTGNIREASNFPNAAEMVNLCREKRLPDVQMVLAFQENVYSVGIDIHSGEPQSQPAQA